jgi:hypothetical protein
MAGRFDEAGFRAQIGPNTQVFAGAWLRSAARIELTERVLELDRPQEVLAGQKSAPAIE